MSWPGRHPLRTWHPRVIEPDQSVDWADDPVVTRTCDEQGGLVIGADGIGIDCRGQTLNGDGTDKGISNRGRMGVLSVSRLILGLFLSGTGNVFSGNAIDRLDVGDFDANRPVLEAQLGTLDHVNVFERHVAARFSTPFPSLAAKGAAEGSLPDAYRSGPGRASE